MIEITIYIRDRSTFETASATCKIDDYIFCEALQPVDVPLPDSDGFTRCMCTPEATIRRVFKKRTDLADMVSERLASEINKIFAQKDTVCGCPIEKEDS